jgi:hypothetical protein
MTAHSRNEGIPRRFVIIDVSDLDAALEWAARNPAAADAFVEVRPLGGSYFATRDK